MSGPSPTRIFVHGVGAVSPAGWDAPALSAALEAGRPCSTSPLDAGAGRRLDVRRVPPRADRPPALQHPRLRRSSAVSQFAVCASVEALGGDAAPGVFGPGRLGIVCTMMGGGVSYSRRFYAEVLANPATASPLLFPETVFNAPAAHLGAVLSATGPNYTLVADQTGFLQGLAVGAEWLTHHEVDGCLVVGAEEADWLTARALGLFSRRIPPAEGGGAVYLRRESSGVELSWISAPVLYRNRRPRVAALTAVRESLPDAGPRDLLLDSLGGDRTDAPEAQVWADWPGLRISPRRILGEGFGAGGAWACVAAVRAASSGSIDGARVHVAGSNLQAMSVGFSRV